MPVLEGPVETLIDRLVRVRFEAEQTNESVRRGIERDALLKKHRAETRSKDLAAALKAGRYAAYSTLSMMSDCMDDEEPTPWQGYVEQNIASIRSNDQQLMGKIQATHDGIVKPDVADLPSIQYRKKPMRHRRQFSLLTVMLLMVLIPAVVALSVTLRKVPKFPVLERVNHLELPAWFQGYLAFPLKLGTFVAGLVIGLMTLGWHPVPSTVVPAMLMVAVMLVRNLDARRVAKNSKMRLVTKTDSVESYMRSAREANKAERQLTHAKEHADFWTRYDDATNWIGQKRNLKQL